MILPFFFLIIFNHHYSQLSEIFPAQVGTKISSINKTVLKRVDDQRTAVLRAQLSHPTLEAETCTDTCNICVSLAYAGSQSSPHAS